MKEVKKKTKMVEEVSTCEKLKQAMKNLWLVWLILFLVVLITFAVSLILIQKNNDKKVDLLQEEVTCLYDELLADLEDDYSSADDVQKYIDDNILYYYEADDEQGVIYNGEKISLDKLINHVIGGRSAQGVYYDSNIGDLSDYNVFSIINTLNGWLSVSYDQDSEKLYLSILNPGLEEPTFRIYNINTKEIDKVYQFSQREIIDPVLPFVNLVDSSGNYAHFHAVSRWETEASIAEEHNVHVLLNVETGDVQYFNGWISDFEFLDDSQVRYKLITVYSTDPQVCEEAGYDYGYGSCQVDKEDIDWTYLDLKI